MVLEAYQDPQDFARALEFGRLVGAGDDKSLTTALAMLDEQRNAIALRLGVDIAGVDPLADFPDLKAAVDNMEITREYAVKLAKGQRQERVQTEQRQAAQQQQQESEQSRRDFEAEVTSLTDQATQYFTTRAGEVDYPAKMEAIKAHFAKPENLQAFVQNFQPKQWLAQFKFMYDNIRTAPAPRPNINHQPLRSRPALGGSPASNPNASSVDRMSATLDSMGI
jgi:anti-sigma28 factor (negative regulator of flagellin synthesis)